MGQALGVATEHQVREPRAFAGAGDGEVAFGGIHMGGDRRCRGLGFENQDFGISIRVIWDSRGFERCDEMRQQEDAPRHAGENAGHRHRAETGHRFIGCEAKRTEADRGGNAAEKDRLAGAVPHRTDVAAIAPQRQTDVDAVINPRSQ